VSGHSDSIRERRARETWRKKREGKTTPTPLAYIVAAKFDDSREQLAVLEKVHQGRLTLEYLDWNGRTR
jgi:hypothetical protein